MVLWGLGLGLGAAYGTLVGIPFVGAVGILALLLGAMVGAMYGAIAGISMGLLEGLILGVGSVLRHRRGASDNSLRYRRTAELICVLTCVSAVASFWGVPFWGSGGSVSLRIAFTRDLPEALILVAGPLILATGTTWSVARRVTGQCTSEFGEPAKHGLALDISKSSVKRERRA